MNLSLRKLAGFAAAALMAASMTTAAFADETAPQAPTEPSTCTTVIHPDPGSKAACPPADQADPAGLSHTMTGGSFTSTCIPYGSRDTEPMDILVASLDTSIGQERLRDQMLVAGRYCCPVKFVLPADPQDESIVASLGADFLLPPAPAKRNRLMLVAC